MGRVGALTAPSLQIAALLTRSKQLVKQQLFCRPLDEARPELREDREVEAMVGELQTKGILPVNPRSHRFRRLSVGEPFTELHDRYQRQSPGSFRWPTSGSKERGEAFVVVDGTEQVTHLHVHIPFRERGVSHASCLVRNGANRFGLQGQHSLPGSGWGCPQYHPGPSLRSPRIRQRYPIEWGNSAT